MNKKVIIVILGMVFSLTSFADSEKYMLNDFIGCKSKDSYRSTLNMMMQDDWEAVARVLMVGDCIELPQGTVLYLDGANLTGLIRVRPKGTTGTWWTGSEQVSK